MIKRLLLTLFSLLCVFFTFAQVTTSGISGTVKDSKGGSLVGATITAIHTPSGTQYATISKAGGVFNIPGMRTGGPYKLIIRYIGFKEQVIEGFNLLLGDTYNVNVDMSETAVDLSTVTVTGLRKRRGAQDQSGASTHIGSYQLATLPSITRTITDYTRLTPQANGTNFAGRDGRLNNVMVDGANLNNNFGINNDLLPGSGNPIALDAFDEISVNLSPFDVKQSGFTGAGVNAITKSGTNTFHGSAYGIYRNQSYNGTNVNGYKLPSPAKQSNKIYGMTLGGPIIQNKLFFFVSGEYEENNRPGVTYYPKGGSGNGIQSNVVIDSLAKLASYLKSQYNFDPGAYDNFPTITSKNHKLLGKIDWNINAVHKLTAKYSDYKSTNYFIISQSGGINGANGPAGVKTVYVPRFGSQAMSFSGTNYSQEDKVKTASLELNSNFHGKFANQFIATYSRITTFKGRDGGAFPFVDIMGITPNDKVNYLSFGNEPFNANNNKVINDVVTITDNFTYFYGKHTLTAGVNYEYQKVGNMFMPGSQGYYIYGSLDDFIHNRAPQLFSLSYSLIPGQDAVYSAEMKVGQFGFYAQDDYVINPRVKVTLGLRVDAPVFPTNPLENPAITALSLYDKNGNLTHYNDGQWPKTSLYFAPRASFRWDVKGDKDIIVRGGTGIFTGRIPFVYLTNQPSTSGMYQYGAIVTAKTGNMSNFLFNPDPHAYNPFYNHNLDPNLFPTKAGSVAPGSFALLDRNFKFPQVWRTELAVEKQLPYGIVASGEVLYTKDINNPFLRNAALNQPDSKITVGAGDTRSYYSSAAAQLINPKVSNAIVLENSNKGYSVALTAKLSKNFSNGWYGSLAYTYTAAKNLSSNPGSQAASAYAANVSPATLNDQILSYSSFAVPHRVVATASYRVEYIGHLASTFTFYYEGSSLGRFSYIYKGDINNDGYANSDLMYIPKDPSDIHFVDIPANGSTPGYTAQQQSDAFFKYIAQDKYLSKHMGQVAQRNAAVMPWYNRVDFTFLQDIFTNIGKSRNTLQFNASIINLLNMLNSNWGVKKVNIITNPLTVNKIVNGVPYFTLATDNNKQLISQTYQDDRSTNSTWGLQLGLKYIF